MESLTAAGESFVVFPAAGSSCPSRRKRRAGSKSTSLSTSFGGVGGLAGSLLNSDDSEPVDDNMVKTASRPDARQERGDMSSLHVRRR